MITIVIKITYIQDPYENVTFFFTFCWWRLGDFESAQTVRIDLICSYDDRSKFPWAQSRKWAVRTLPGRIWRASTAHPQIGGGQFPPWVVVSSLGALCRSVHVCNPKAQGPKFIGRGRSRRIPKPIARPPGRPGSVWTAPLSHGAYGASYSQRRNILDQYGTV